MATGSDGRADQQYRGTSSFIGNHCGEAALKPMRPTWRVSEYFINEFSVHRQFSQPAAFGPAERAAS